MFLPPHQLLFLLCLACACTAYTYEPPGRDPVSIAKVRAAEQAVALTTDNFDALTAGKRVFVKVYSPHCPHCKSMAGAWNQLAAHYRDRPDGDDDILIGSVDCTDLPARGLCMRFKINGLPTLLYGDASQGGVYLEEYGGDKTPEDLTAFAAEALVRRCGPGDPDACAPAARAEVEGFLALSRAGLQAYIDGGEREVRELRDAFRRAKADLQKEHDRHLLEKELLVTRIRARVRLIEEIAAAKS